MKRLEAHDIIHREMTLTWFDFRKSPTALNFTALESCMLAWQWVETRADWEVAPFVDLLPPDLPGKLLVDMVSEGVRAELFQIDQERVAASLGRKRKDLRKPARRAGT